MSRRDEYPYTVTVYDADDNVLIATEHRHESSATVELDAARRRLQDETDRAHTVRAAGPEDVVTITAL